MRRWRFWSKPPEQPADNNFEMQEFSKKRAKKSVYAEHNFTYDNPVVLRPNTKTISKDTTFKKSVFDKFNCVKRFCADSYSVFMSIIIILDVILLAVPITFHFDERPEKGWQKDYFGVFTYISLFLYLFICSSKGGILQSIILKCPKLFKIETLQDVEKGFNLLSKDPMDDFGLLKKISNAFSMGFLLILLYTRFCVLLSVSNYLIDDFAILNWILRWLELTVVIFNFSAFKNILDDFVFNSLTFTFKFWLGVFIFTSYTAFKIWFSLDYFENTTEYACIPSEKPIGKYIYFMPTPEKKSQFCKIKRKAVAFKDDAPVILKTIYLVLQVSIVLFISCFVTSVITDKLKFTRITNISNMIIILTVFTVWSYFDGTLEIHIARIFSM